jgi:hypothetical protein
MNAPELSLDCSCGSQSQPHEYVALIVWTTTHVTGGDLRSRLRQHHDGKPWIYDYIREPGYDVLGLPLYHS